MSSDGSFDSNSIYLADSCPYGLTYGQWTVKWWNWFMSTPRFMNAVIDESGKFAPVNQPLDDVWFLAGIVGDESKSIPDRFCRIPASRSILLPVINCEVNPLECPELHTHHDLIERVSSDESTITLKECSVDGKPVLVQRVKSDPYVFELEINNNNVYGVEGHQSTWAAADGYWVFLRPLPAGKHSILFRGSCEMGKLNSGANYTVLIE